MWDKNDRDMSARGSDTDEGNVSIRLLSKTNRDLRLPNFKHRITFISCLFLTIFFLFYYEEYLENTAHDLTPIPQYEEAFVNESNDIHIPTKRRGKKIKIIPECPENVTITKAKALIKDTSGMSISKLNKTLQETIQMGGYYTPKHCQPRYKVAILVAIRDLEDQLQVFLFHMHPFLMRQNLEYRIFVIEQSSEASINKGRLFNAGFLEIERMGGWQCVVFHDVDLLPTDDSIRYSCPKIPTQLYAYADKENVSARNITSAPDRSLSVLAISATHFKMVNGFSNEYWRWGGEDVDIIERLKAAAITVNTYDREKTWSTPQITMKKNRRMDLLKTAIQRYRTDGISNVQYKKICETVYPLYTKILVDVNPSKPEFKHYRPANSEIVPSIFV